MESALSWADEITAISKDEIDIIRHSRKSFLFSNGNPWVKTNNPTFDVTMGSLDGAEICEMVGLYILNKLRDIIPFNQYGLYRDDGLAMISGSGPEMDRLWKDIIKLFKEMNLKVTIETNLMITDYLDVTFNLTNGSFTPYTKPGNIIRYISSNSNHPPHIKKQIPRMVKDRLSLLSSNEEIFEREAHLYRKALLEAGYNDEIKYEKFSNNKKTRKRNIIWFKPPWSDTIITKIGSLFLKLIEKHFPSNDPLRKLFNKNSLKLSYGCLPNVNSFISAQNRKLLSNISTDKVQCNCRGGVTACPVNGRCKEENVVYKVTVNTLENSKTYIGSTVNFKDRFNQHQSSFRLHKYKNNTALSTYIWSLKETGKDYSTSWNIIAKAKAYTPESKKCNLCTAEKAKILFYKGEDLINKRSEIMAKC